MTSPRRLSLRQAAAAVVFFLSAGMLGWMLLERRDGGFATSGRAGVLLVGLVVSSGYLVLSGLRASRFAVPTWAVPRSWRR